MFESWGHTLSSQKEMLVSVAMLVTQSRKVLFLKASKKLQCINSSTGVNQRGFIDFDGAMSIYTRWGFGPLYGDIFISLLTLSVKERVIIRKLEAITCVWGGGSFIIANLILFPVKCIRRIEPGACWPVCFVKKYLFKSVYNNLSAMDRLGSSTCLPPAAVAAALQLAGQWGAAENRPGKIWVSFAPV